jgi:2-methylisocitrate lyase-like PEP mutase family enzyme
MYNILKVAPKACGHTEGRKVISREESVMHIKAAIDARKESASDIVIVARTDSRQAVSLDEALWRVQAFADAGADVLFIDALASVEEMKAFCAVAPGVPKMVRCSTCAFSRYMMIIQGLSLYPHPSKLPRITF